MEYVYESPAIVEYGALVLVAQGSGGNDGDDCSSGMYQNNEE